MPKSDKQTLENLIAKLRAQSVAPESIPSR